jgi:hypothetical protein
MIKVSLDFVCGHLYHIIYRLGLYSLLAAMSLCAFS